MKNYYSHESIDKKNIDLKLKLSKKRNLELIFKRYSQKLKDKINKYFYIIKSKFTILFFILLFLFIVFKSNISNHEISNDIDCIIVNNKFKNRTQPFDFVNEFFFFTELIKCKIPFSFIRFGDGENSIMKGVKFKAWKDEWHWNPKNNKFQYSLIESSSICTNNNSFIGIPCKDWIEVSKSILSFSKCSSAKYMSYATLFINKNYPFFKDWVLNFINTSFPNRWKIILVANSIIQTDITWAYKFVPVPDHLIENWDKYCISLLSKLSRQAKKNNLIFFVFAGPAANIIISYLVKINNNNIYIDFGSSIEFITKGYSTRPYSKGDKTSRQSCEPFYLQNKSIIYIG